MAKYAPAREDGLKPYVVAISSWGHTHEVLVWAKDAADARYRANGRSLYTTAKARRALVGEVL